ncbi:thioredoxin domain-containing protein [Granulicella cerasi]|uniref:Thioredoxin domain-containing protein n=1 Tax=Granulicella cerasi TaxID=741063 RepID=A0ABW1Z4H5_9BACT|nr:thioredoxin domain-containing protein [Granulicella cerasi]
MSEQMTHDHGTENALAKSASGYLRSARHQPVLWMEWGTEAFAKAQAEDKPVLLDIGAVWCHWCHVMDRESYEDAATAEMINEHFIAVKVDRDERPDVDARYQAAVSAISGQGGWPLTAFLTPDGRPYFGGTYFPPDDRYQRPSFRRVLGLMADAYEDKRDEVLETAGSVMAALEHNENFSGRAAGVDGELGREILAKLINAPLRQFDGRNGGFGSQPKFPHSGAIDLLIDAAGRGGVESDNARMVAETTLRKMASGGIHDQLAGGFHRYSVDERWIVPHFEKMAYDNADLLKNYAHAFASFAQPDFAQVANGIVKWMDEWLSDRKLGGFYGSQDADDSLEDDGDYFTWTRDEAKAVLSPEEFAAASAFYNLRPVGDMHHNPLKNVLHVAPAKVDEAALERAHAKMYAARLLRKTPYVDKTIYVGWNGMCISAYFTAAAALNLPEARTFALKSMDRVLATAWDGTTLQRVVAYGEQGGTATPIPAVLEDYAFVTQAALDAFEASGELRYYEAAKGLTDAMLLKFYDAEGGAFFDAELQVEAIGALAARRKPLQDSPTPSGNSVAANVLLRVGDLSGDDTYVERGRETLETFAGVVEHFGLYAASYALSLRRLLEGGLQIAIVGEGQKAEELALAATMRYAANKSIIRLSREQMGALPPALAETLPHLPEAEAVALVCRGKTCAPPVFEPEALLDLLDE